jgi:hypothetical protein
MWSISQAKCDTVCDKEALCTIDVNKVDSSIIFTHEFILDTAQNGKTE